MGGPRLQQVFSGQSGSVDMPFRGCDTEDARLGQRHRHGCVVHIPHHMLTVLELLGIFEAHARGLRRSPDPQRQPERLVTATLSQPR